MPLNSDKINFIIKHSNLDTLINKLSDLTKISDILKFKIDKDNILVYSLVGETAILAFKNYLLDTKEYFTFNDDNSDFDFTLDFIVLNAKKFVKNLSFFSSDIKCRFVYRQSPTDNVMYVRSLVAKDDRFKLNYIGAEPYKVRDINKEKLKVLLSPDNSEWSFQLNNIDFDDVKKLSSINSDEKIITISTSKGNIHIGEVGTWDLIVSKCDGSYSDITFPKKYLSSINYEEDILNFMVFETFILFKEKDTNLMVSFEQSFEDEDDI